MDRALKDAADAKAKSREAAVQMLRGIKAAHADWLDGDNLSGRALRRAGTPFSAAYDDLEKWLNETKPAKRPRAKTGFVYFIGLEGDAAVVKIGFASNVANRLSTLQTSSHHKLRILIAIKGSTAKEKELHRQFASDHIRGEWFRKTQAIETFIAVNNDNVSERVGGTQSM